ncbi:uncharacterized protein LOC116260459 isoform X3 [Nymphaea colorata]|uniref:uncharacterized protein LOC116260459 isoform X3 n=1 Tax=Nymphaea colorata TaxID=210225 RepID=UPI00214EBFB5|nr:uncharacterized protein LOC116260459 isoform X3 [Nymphaea colorata]
MAMRPRYHPICRRLHALCSVESSSQRLGQTYAFLLVCEILLDVSWFVLFFREIWNMSTEKYSALDIFSVRVALWMEIIGFLVRCSSTFIWIQMCRLGASCVDNVYRESDVDPRTSLLSSANYLIVQENSDYCDAVGGFIVDSTYYSSLFEDVEDGGCVYELFLDLDEALALYHSHVSQAPSHLRRFAFHGDEAGTNFIPICISGKFSTLYTRRLCSHPRVSITELMSVPLNFSRQSANL